MDVVLKGRGLEVTDRVRRCVEQKLAKIGRLDRRVRRLEVEITLERNPRITGSHRVEVACDAVRHVFRASGAGQDVESALDQVVRRLERQITSFRGKLRERRQAGPPGR
jgi:ribosomal subunit interface protein